MAIVFLLSDKDTKVTGSQLLMFKESASGFRSLQCLSAFASFASDSDSDSPFLQRKLNFKIRSSHQACALYKRTTCRKSK